MSRNRRSGGGGVRGPASALTSFLASLGVEPSSPLTTWGNASAIPSGSNADGEGDATGSNTPGVADSEPVASGSHARSEAESPAPAPKRVKRAVSIDSDDLDADTKVSEAVTPTATTSKVKAQPLRAVGEFMDCGECCKRFTVTTYTKEHPSYPSTWLCVKCCYSLGIDPFEKPKKASKAKAGAKKDERAKVVHYEQRKGVVPLSELCIQMIGRCIEDVEQLGDIGAVNMDKVCKIISKNRQLTPETATLFYSVERKELSLYDCTRLVHESYLAMAKLCPKLEYLRLNLCGQLTTEAVTSWSKSLKQLRRLDLNGPFLVRKDAWHALFRATGKSLETLLITQSPRIDTESISILADSCPNVVELRLSEIGQLDDSALPSLSKLKKLRYLDLSSPGGKLSEAAVVSMLSEIGQGLIHLDLSDNPELGDGVLDSIAEHCHKLQHLSLRGLRDLTDDAVAAFFDQLKRKRRPGLHSVDLEKGDDLQGNALRALVSHSGTSIEDLSLLGWRNVDTDALSHLARCPVLKKLNIGWCRAVTDYSVKDVLDSCKHIQVISVWGCNQLTAAVPRRKGVRVVGVETLR